MQKKQPAPKKEVIQGPIGPDDPICPYFDRDKKKCAAPSCYRLHTPCKFWDADIPRRALHRRRTGRADPEAVSAYHS